AHSAARGVVDKDGCRSREILIERIELAYVLDGDRADFANARSAVSMSARKAHQRFFIKVVAVEMIVEVGKDLVVLDEWCHRARSLPEIAAIEDRISGVDGVAEISGIAKIMTGSDGRGIGGSESREQ